MVVEIGLTVIEFPEPTGVPPQLLLYHCQFAPVPNEPPATVSVDKLPLQITAGDGVILVGVVES